MERKGGIGERGGGEGREGRLKVMRRRSWMA
jgi:hypothetical protein